MNFLYDCCLRRQPTSQSHQSNQLSTSHSAHKYLINTPAKKDIGNINSNDRVRHYQPTSSSFKINTPRVPLVIPGNESNQSNNFIIVNPIEYNQSQPLDPLQPILVKETIDKSTEVKSLIPGFRFNYTSNCEFITETACCICFYEYYEGMSMHMLPCNHIFHYPCICEWYQKHPICPMCRDGQK